MRCEDCLPLIEEYFDGEVEGTAAASMGAHLAACATCAAALDALSFEQEIYARYDRRLEVGPDLWARVSAEIARDTLPESPAAPRPFLSRVREQLAAALGALAVRPALASSLALLLVVAAGSLWLSRPQQTVQPVEVADNGHAGGAPEAHTVITNTNPAAVPPAVTTPEAYAPAGVSLTDETADANHTAAAPTRDDTRAAGGRRPNARPTGRPNGADVDLETLLAPAPAAQASQNVVSFGADEHAGADDEAALFVNASAPAGEVAAGDARLLDPEEKELARHVEQAQMLLRSIKNARADRAGSVDVAYEKTLSRKLLAQNATLQLEAEVKGDKGTKQVLDTIEPFLLDIANLRENPSRDEMRSIRERVRKNQIVAALEVY
ncbi:MAG TPA: zf-HC2 domain-containing protein [Pyrinomonadaceae bacterium]|jgi:hypothetical protein